MSSLGPGRPAKSETSLSPGATTLSFLIFVDDALNPLAVWSLSCASTPVVEALTPISKVPLTILPVVACFILAPLTVLCSSLLSQISSLCRWLYRCVHSPVPMDANNACGNQTGADCQCALRVQSVGKRQRRRRRRMGQNLPSSPCGGRSTRIPS